MSTRSGYSRKTVRPRSVMVEMPRLGFTSSPAFFMCVDAQATRFAKVRAVPTWNPLREFFLRQLELLGKCVAELWLRLLGAIRVELKQWPHERLEVRNRHGS
jgi:hypothetical protein